MSKNTITSEDTMPSLYRTVQPTVIMPDTEKSLLGFSFLRPQGSLNQVNDLQQIYKTIINEYVSCIDDFNRFTSICSIINSYKKTRDLFIFCNINSYPVALKDIGNLTIKHREKRLNTVNHVSVPHSRQENWLTIAITKKSELNCAIYINGWLDLNDVEVASRYSVLKNLLKSITSELYQDICNKMHPTNSIVDALMNMQRLKNQKTISIELRGFLQDTATIDCNKLMVDTLSDILETGYFNKTTLEDALFFVNRVMDNVNYMPSNNLLTNLLRILTDPLYNPELGEQDLQFDVIQLIYNLKIYKKINFDEVFGVSNKYESAYGYISGYFKSIKDIHYTKKQVEEARTEFASDLRDSKKISSLDWAIKQRGTFLRCQARLSPETLNKNDLEEFFNGFGNHFKLDKLKEKFEKSYSKLNTSNLSPTEKIDIHEQKEQLQHQIDYLSVLADIRAVVDSDELIIALGMKVVPISIDRKANVADIKNNVESVELSKDAVSTLIAFSMSTKNVEVVKAVMKILIASDLRGALQDVELEQWCKNALQHISKERGAVDKIIGFAQMLCEDSLVVDSVVNYIYQLLIDGEDNSLMKSALKILKAYDQNNMLKDLIIKATIELEDKCITVRQYYNAEQQSISTRIIEELKKSSSFTSQSDTVINECLNYVLSGKKLTFRCFELLGDLVTLQTQKIKEIIRCIVIQDLQIIPEVFLNRFKEYVEEVKNKDLENRCQELENIGIMNSLLIEGGYIDLEDVSDLVIKLLDKPMIQDNTLDIILTAIQCGQQIPEKVTAKIATLSQNATLSGNTYLSNVLRAVKRSKAGHTKDDLDIVMNPRTQSETRLEKLKLILLDQANYTPHLAKQLQQLVMYDQDLGLHAFNTLLKILPLDYSKKGFAIDVSSIVRSVYGMVSLDDIIILAHKDAVNAACSISLLVDMLINDIAIDTDKNKSLNLLEEFIGKKEAVTNAEQNYETKEKEKSTSEGHRLKVHQIIFLFKLANATTSASVRVRILKIIQDNSSREELAEIKIIASNNEGQTEEISDLKTEVMELTDNNDLLGSPNGVNLDSIQKLKSAMESGYLITEAQIDVLIKSLSHVGTLHNQIASILLKIDDKQSLINAQWSAIFEIIAKNDDLISISEVVHLITQGVYREFNQQVMITVIGRVLKQFNRNHIKDKEQMYRLIVAVRTLLSKGYVIADAVLEQVRVILVPSATISAIIDTLKTISLGTNTHLTKIAFQTLFQILEKKVQQKDAEFIVNYYRILHNMIKLLPELLPSDDAGLSKLEEYIHKKSNEDNDIRNKLYLLNALSNSLIDIKSIDLSIFTEFSSHLWGRELLYSQLLKNALSCTSKLNEFELDLKLKKFRENANDLGNFIGTQEEQLYRHEKVLQALIDRREDWGIDIINDILVLLQSSNEAINIIYNNECNFYIKLRELWLEATLTAFGIEFTEQKLSDFNNYLLPYDVLLITNVLSKLKTETELIADELYAKKDASIEQLIGFFSYLNEAGLSIIESETFLASDVTSNSSVQSWSQKLSDRLVKILLQQKFTKGGQALVGNDNLDMGLLDELHRKLVMIVEAGWSLSSIEHLISNINGVLQLKHLIDALDPIYEYSLKEYDYNIREETILEIFKKWSSTPENWLGEIHQLAIYNTFTGSYDKSITHLFDEILERNEGISAGILQYDKLKGQFEQVIKTYDDKSLLADKLIITDVESRGEKDDGREEKQQNVRSLPKDNLSDKPINQWSAEEIGLWAQKVRSNKVPLHEKLAVVKKAVEITSDFPPRDIQLLSVLIMLNPVRHKGILAQINTGEGKTTIVAMLAVIKALEGHTVDIITSSSELAKPQSKQQAKFFNIFGLTVAHNAEDGTDKKEKYKANIVYGAAGDFQGDILRDEYSKFGTRCGRICDVAIVDEVDSMLIDGKNHIVMLSTHMPGMDYLEPILAAIWIQIGEVAKRIKEISGKTYFIESEGFLDEQDKIRRDIVDQLFPIESTKEEFIRKCTEKHIRKLLRDDSLIITDASNNNYDAEWNKYIDDEKKDTLEGKGFPKLVLPVHLRELVTKIQLPKWIDSAIYAKYKCEYGKLYILENGKIAPVDASNTGVVQQNMHWNNGLHQFLQIKHGAKITPESLTTNLISNVAYFKRYGTNIYGLTGTLGSTGARKLLDDTYYVDSVIIPPFRQKQYKELTSVITDQENYWYTNIIKTSLSKLRQNRGVLVITEYIKTAEEIAKRLREYYNYDKAKIKLYKTSDDSHLAEEELKPGEIIIATNIAGRGTDIKPHSQVEKNGGLHVCITFLPANERVEQQNVGRTSRTGNKGTGQFILCTKESNDLAALKAIRNAEEAVSLKRAEDEIERVTNQDAVFEKFCKLLDIFNNLDRQCPTVKAVEERFGIWLKMQEMSCEEILSNFKEFEAEILADNNSNTLIKNQCYYVLLGNKFLHDNKYEAISNFDKAIELDRYFAVNAYYNRGYAKLMQYVEDVKENRLIEEAMADLQESRRIIEEHLEPMLNLIQQASNSPALSEQVYHKMVLYNVQKNIIEQAAGKGELKVAEEIKILKKQRGQDGVTSQDIKAIDKGIKDIEDRRAILASGIIGQALKNKNEIKIELVNIRKSLPEDQDVNLYTEEIFELNNNGFLGGGIQVTEVKPIPWFSVIGMGLLALGQMIGGAALAVFSLGAGSSIGMSLLTEGVSDLIMAVKDGIINRSLDWASWAVQKAIGLTVSIVCAGFGAIKDAAKTSVAGIKTAGQAIKGGLTQSIKTGWKLAAKAIGVSLAKGVAKEIVTQLVDCFISQALMPSIEQEIIKIVEQPIQDALLTNENIRKMLELDCLNRSNYYQSLIKRKAMELLNPQNDHEHALLTITKGIAKGIACNKIPGLSSVMQIGEAAKALGELRTYVPKFTAKLDAVIKEICNKEKIDEKYSQARSNQQLNNKQQARDATCSPKEKTDVHQSSSVIAEPNTIPSSDIDLSKGEEDQIQTQLVSTVNSPNKLRSALSSSISVNMCNIIKGKLITPIANTGISCGMSKLTAGIDKSLQEQIGGYRDQRILVFNLSGDKDTRVPEDQKQISEEARPMAELKAKKIIEDLEQGEEAGLPHLGPISHLIDKPIEIYDNEGRLVDIIGSHKEGEPIKIERHTNSDGSGHWTLLGGKEAPISGNNNCLFDVIGTQIGQNGDELRQSTVSHMQANKESLICQTVIISRLEAYKRDALMMGGAKRYPEHLEVSLEDIDTIKALAAKRPDQPNFEKRSEEHFDHQFDKKDRTLNHIIPGSTINNKIVDADPKELRKQLNYFINKPEVRNMIVNDPDFDGNHAKTIHKNIFWFSNNLVAGPQNIRTDDPGNGLDQPILKQQSPQYQKQVNLAFNAPPNKFFYQFSQLSRPKPVPWEYRQKNDKKGMRVQKGLNYVIHNDIYGISPFFNEYTIAGIQDILKLRLLNEGVNLSNIRILPHYYAFMHYRYSNIGKMLFDVKNTRNNKSGAIVLVVVSLYGQHAVGFMFICNTNYQFDNNTTVTDHSSISGSMVYYINPSNEPIPMLLAKIFKDHGYPIVEQLSVEQQRYSNCGPEVIENFMLYLTGERLSQEEAIIHNSLLVEQKLMKEEARGKKGGTSEHKHFIINERSVCPFHD